MKNKALIDYYNSVKHYLPSRNIFIIIVVYSLFLCIESWIFAPYSYIPRHDTGDDQVPVFYTYVNSIWDNGLSRWYPYHLGGVDEFATYNIFQLITPFYLLLPLWLAFASVLFLQHFFAIFFLEKYLMLM